MSNAKTKYETNLPAEVVEVVSTLHGADDPGYVPFVQAQCELERGPRAAALIRKAEAIEAEDRERAARREQALRLRAAARELWSEAPI